MADVLPEGVKAAGAQDVVINHCEKPMSLPQIKATIDRVRERDSLVFACADTLAEAEAIAHLHPDIINPEPSEFIGRNATIATVNGEMDLGGFGRIHFIDQTRGCTRTVKVTIIGE